MTHALTGLWPPVSTPFHADGEIDFPRLVKHGKTLLAEGAHGLAPLGTTSEANSLGLSERRQVIDALVEGGIDGKYLLPGTGACSVEEAASLTRHAADVGCAGVLLLPPFYYKKVTDEGIFTFVARVIDKVGANVPKIMLYHIPPMATIGWSNELVGRLIEAYPDVVVGMKDSSGDFEHTKSVIEAFPGFSVFPGAEVYVLKALKLGAAGCISASANLSARGIRRLLDTWRNPDAQDQQDALNAVRKAVESRVMIAAIKVVLAERYHDPVWRNVRPPLMAMDDKGRAELLAEPAIQKLLQTEPA